MFVVLAHVSMGFANKLYAGIRYNTNASFILRDSNSSVELPNPTVFSGGKDNIAHWSKQAFRSYENPQNFSLWGLFTQDGDVMALDQSSGQEFESYIDPSRFYIPENRQVHVTEDTLIDGNGQTLELERDARIVVDHGVTLTLRNMRIKSMRNSLSNPIIRPTGHDAIVALQDVELALADDFIFRDGHLFIHDDVLISGTHTFSYRSTQTSYICNGATLGFDKGSTFWYYPSSQDNHLIQMLGDVSGGGSSGVSNASMYFDGATLLTTHTGMRLSNGVLCLDNNVTLSSAANTRFTSLTEVAIENVFTTTFAQYDGVKDAVWSPDGKYLAVGVNRGSIIGSELQVYRFDESTSTLTLVDHKDDGIDTALTLDWSPDGKYLAVGTGTDPAISEPGITSGDELQIFKFDALTQTLAGVTSINEGADVMAVSWSPDGKYLVVGTPTSATYSDSGITSGDELQIFRFDASVKMLTGVASINEGIRVRSVSWNFDDKYIAVGTDVGPSYSDSGINAGDELQVFRFDVSTGTLSGVESRNEDISVLGIAWSPNGKHLAVGQGGNQVLKVYTFNSLTETFTGVVTINSVIILTVAWSPDGHYIMVGGWNNQQRVYRFDGATLTLVWFNTLSVSPTNYIAWRPDGHYLAMVTRAFASASTPPSYAEIHIYRVNYASEIASQGLNNGIIFGDSSQAGGLGNLDVQVLGGSYIEVNGIVVDDSV